MDRDRGVKTREARWVCSNLQPNLYEVIYVAGHWCIWVHCSAGGRYLGRRWPVCDLVCKCWQCLVYISIFAGVRVVGVCALVYACTHTQTTWVLDVSPGVGRTPGEPEKSWSTKAQYTCRPYRCTQYICLYIFCAAGFDDLGKLLFASKMSFLFRKVEDVTTISKSQSLTSVSIKDCTLRVANKTTTVFLYEQ